MDTLDKKDGSGYNLKRKKAEKRRILSQVGRQRETHRLKGFAESKQECHLGAGGEEPHVIPALTEGQRGRSVYFCNLGGTTGVF